MTGNRWANRIIGHEEVAPDQLLANPKNWRVHPQYQQQAMSGVLDEIGWLDEVKVNRNTDTVVDGHMRVALAISKGEASVPVTYLDLTEAEEAVALATFDPISALAVADREQQRALLEEARSQDAAVNALLSQLRAEAQEPAKGAGDKQDGELAISAELFERHDYLLIYFDNQMDWQVACERFDIGTVESAPVGKRTLRQKGIGRVIAGKKLLELIGADE